MADFTIRPIDSEDKQWILSLLRDRWSAEFVLVHGEVFHPEALPGFIAETATAKTGWITYSITQGNCEIVTLDSLEAGRGIGGALIESTKAAARNAGCRRLFVVTTNDNLLALRFYQRRGFTLCALRPNALEQTRKRKPVPLIGSNGIPIRDEIELEMPLDQAGTVVA